MVSPGVNSKTVTDKLWKDLNLENNKILKHVAEISDIFYQRRFLCVQNIMGHIQNLTLA